MIISIDESGIHRQNGFSIIALICVNDAQTLTELNSQIENLEKSIGTTSFHWANKGRPFRRDFVVGLNDLHFTIRLAQISNPVKFDIVLGEVLPYLIPERKLEHLFIDGKKHKHYVRTLKKVLRDKGITVKKLKTVNDEAYPSILV